MSSFNVASVLEKMGKADKDFRHVGTTDLLKELSKDGFKVDASAEAKLAEKLLGQLGDSSKEVQTLTVKVIPLMMRVVRENTLKTFVKSLADNILKGKEEIRDVSALSLVDALNELTPASPNGSLVAKALPGTCIAGLQMADDDVNMRSLDVLQKLLKSYGSQIQNDHAAIQDALLGQLNHKRQAVAKQVVACIANLSVCENDKLFQALIKHLMNKLSNPEKGDNLSNYISAIGSASRTVGHRIGPFLGELVPLVLKNIGDSSKAGPSDTEIEITKNCLSAFENFVSRCPQEVAPHLPAILEQCLTWLGYDPNIMDDDDDDDDSEEDSDEYSDDGADDEDSTWMIRKAAAKCLAAIISTRTELLSMLCERVAPALIARFKEREVGVQENVFQTFEVLLQQVASAGVKSGSTLSALEEKIPTIASSAKSQLNKGERTQMNAFSLLSELIRVLPNALKDNVGDVVPGVVAALESDSKPLINKALKFLRALLASHPPAAFHPHMEALVGPSTGLVKDPLFRIASDALRVVGELVRVCRPDIAGTGEGGFDYKPHVTPLYACVTAKLAEDNTDQEVKQCAIRSLGYCVAVFGGDLGADLEKALQALTNGLNNELTQTFAVRSIGEVAQSPLKVDVSSVLSKWVADSAAFLRKADRSLRQASLFALSNLTQNYSDKISDGDFEAMLKEVAAVVSEADLNLSHLGLQLGVVALAARPASVQLVTSTFGPQCHALVRSNVLQGTALESLVAFYTALVSKGGVDFDALFAQLTANIDDSTPKQAFSSIAQCIGAVSAACDGASDKAVTKFLGDLSGQTPPPRRVLALTSIGEIGARTDLSKHADLEKKLLAAFDSESEDQKWAASFALGSVAVGAMAKYVPFLLAEIRASPKAQYLLLQSIKEVIARQAAAGSKGAGEIKPYTEQVWTLLFEFCSSEQEGTRSIVAECLGKLALTDPKTLIPALEERLSSSERFTRGTVIAALRFTMSIPSDEVHALLEPRLAAFFKLLADTEVLVRRSALMTLSFALSNTPELIYDHISSLLPMVYAETPLKPELIRMVKMGPFTQKYDDGADNRKLAFECMLKILKTARDKLSMAEYIKCVVGGLSDTQLDIILLCHQILIRAAGPSLLQALDEMVKPFQATLTKKLKDSAKETEKNDHAANVNSTLRTVCHLDMIPGADSCVAWSAFMAEVVQVGPTGEEYAKVKDSLVGGTTNQTMDTS